MVKRTTSVLLVGVLLALGLAKPATAASLSYVGAFTADDDVASFTFSLASPATVTIKTYSYAGGTQADGNVVPAGGFDPILALFNGAGTLINFVDDGSSVADPNTKMPFDALLETALGAGTYTVTLMQYNNFANGPSLSDGFEKSGQSTFTQAFGCGGTMFCDSEGNQRNGNWALDILNVNAANPVPLPAALPLFAFGMAAVGLAARRRGPRS